MEFPLGFRYVTIFRKDFTFSRKPVMLYKVRYILWVALLLGACDAIQDGRLFLCHLGFYRKLEIFKKR